MPTGCPEVRLELGAYVLGGSSPAERALVDRHIAVCPQCRAELASLAPLPALLRRITAEQAERRPVPPPPAAPPPDRLLNAILSRVTRQRRASHQL